MSQQINVEISSSSQVAAPAPAPAPAPPALQMISVGTTDGGNMELTPFYGWVSKTVEPYLNWMELLMMVLTVCTTSMSVLSMPKPGETDYFRGLRASSLLGLATFILLFYISRIYMDRALDYATCFYYKATLNGNKVFYFKSIIHIFSFLTLLGSACVAAANFVKFKKGKQEASFPYWVALASNAINGIAYVLTYFRMQTKIASVRRDGDMVFSRRLQPCRDIPPQGRVRFYECRRDLQEEELV